MVQSAERVCVSVRECAGVRVCECVKALLPKAMARMPGPQEKPGRWALIPDPTLSCNALMAVQGHAW